MVSMKFELPIGYTDESGKVHKEGQMRPVKGRDIVEVQRSPEVQALAKENHSLKSPNPVALTLAANTMTIMQSHLLPKVVLTLGDLPKEKLTQEFFQNELYVMDTQYLQTIFNEVNGIEVDTADPFGLKTSPN